MAAQPTSVTLVFMRLSSLSLVSTPAGRDRAPVGGGGGATRAASPASPIELLAKPSVSRSICRRKAGARATSPESPMPVVSSWRLLSRGRAPRPMAAASAEAPASPKRIAATVRRVMAGSAPALSSSASRCTPSAPPPQTRNSFSSAGSTEPSEPIVPSSAEVRRSGSPFERVCHSIAVASRSSLQLCIPTLRHSAAATS
eukprot:scaffold117829_cov47-Phaeocystis_antarctica.AAC.4